MSKIITGRTVFSLRRGVEMFEREVERFSETAAQNKDLAYDCYGVTLVHSLRADKAPVVMEQMGFDVRSSADHYNLGCSAAQKEEYPKAIDHFRKAAEMDSSLLQAVYNLAVCFERTKQFSAAISTWQTYADSLKDASQRDEVKVIKERVAALKAQK